MKNIIICFLTDKEASKASEVIGIHFPDAMPVSANDIAKNYADFDNQPSPPFLLTINTIDQQLANFVSNTQSETNPAFVLLIIDQDYPSANVNLENKDIFDLTVSTRLGMETIAKMIASLKDDDAKDSELEEAERKYQTLVDNLPGVSYRCKNDSDWTMLNLSRKIDKLTGYPARDFIQNKNLSFSDIIYPQDREQVWITIQKALKNKRSYQLEYRIKTAHGRIKWVWEQGRAVIGKNGESLLEGVIIDIDTQKNIEKRIEIMRDMALALSTSKDLVELIEIIKQVLGKVVSTEHLMLALYDREKREFMVPYVEDGSEYFLNLPLGLTLNSLVIKRNRSIFLKEREIDKLFRQGKIKLTEPPPKVWLGVPLHFHDKTSGIIVLQDFTNEFGINETDQELLEFISAQVSVIILKRQAEDETSKLLQALEQNPGAVFITDLKGRIIYGNQKSSQIAGFRLEEIIGSIPNILNPEMNDKETIDDIWQTLLNDKEWKGQFHNINKSGEKYWELAHFSSIKNHRGKTTYYIYLKEDITDRIKIETDLKKAFQRAEESDKLKTAFLANMSHEIRTPMNAIIGFTEMLCTDEYTPEDQKQFVNLVLENSRKLLNTLDNIIDIAKIEVGHLKISKTRCSANKILYDNYYTFDKIREKIGKGHIQLITKQHKEDANLLFESDAFRINQVIINLLENAFKYTTQGYIELGYKLINEDETTFIDFYVKDSGIGVPSDKREIIFERFSQASNNYMATAGGTGLGLAISKNIAHLLGGDLRIESEMNQGSVFHFLIPYIEIDTQAAIAPKQKVDKKPMHWPEKTILIAEDEDSNFTLLDIMLRKTRAKIERAYNGKQAVDYVKGGNDVDLVLMDVRMPVMNGYEATEIIKEFNPELPVIIQTAFAMSGDRDNSFKAGCDDYLSKPIMATDLYRLLKKFLD